MTMLDTELVLLEETWNEECKCESHHRNTTCSVEVVGRFSYCEGGWMICRNAANRNKSRMLSGVYCADCYRPAKDCWRIIPI